MRAAVIKQHGPPESIIFEDRPVPVPGTGQCLIRIRACGLNHLDTWVRRGVPGHKFPLPMVPGSDMAGTIEETGPGVAKFKTGDRVVVDPGQCCTQCPACISGREFLCSKWGLMGETGDGGCQEYVVVPERQVHALSPKLSFEQAACIPINYVTSWQMLVGKAKIQRGESILIHAAGSGVSIACMQIAKLHGLQVYVTSSSEEKLKRAEAMGAERWPGASKRVDVVVDHVAGPKLMESVRALNRGGRLVSCGATAGAEVTIGWNHVFFKNIALLGSTYGSSADFQEVLKRFESGELSAVIDSEIPLADLAKAHEAIEGRKVFGKIIAKI